MCQSVSGWLASARRLADRSGWVACRGPSRMGAVVTARVWRAERRARLDVARRSTVCHFEKSRPTLAPARSHRLLLYRLPLVTESKNGFRAASWRWDAGAFHCATLGPGAPEYVDVRITRRVKGWFLRGVDCWVACFAGSVVCEREF